MLIFSSGRRKKRSGELAEIYGSGKQIDWSNRISILDEDFSTDPSSRFSLGNAWSWGGSSVSFSEAASILDSYSEANQNTQLTIFHSTNNTQAGQVFQAGASGNLTKAKFYLNKLGTPTGSMKARLYAMTGTFGTSGVPTGSPLATSESVGVAALTSSFALIDFIFLKPYAVTSGTNYAIVVDFSETLGDASNYVRIGLDTTAPTHSGNRFIQSAGVYSANSGQDVIFYVYGDPNLTYDFDGEDGKFYNGSLNVGGTIGYVLVSLGTAGSVKKINAGSGVTSFEGFYRGDTGLIITPSSTFNGTIDTVLLYEMKGILKSF